MTHFLRANFVAERLRIIHDELTTLKASLGQRILTENCGDCTAQDALAVDYLLEVCGEITDLLEQLPCQPLVYTGEESTEEVIGLLNRLLHFHRLGQVPDANKDG